jgi:hypothetical protein
MASLAKCGGGFMKRAENWWTEVSYTVIEEEAEFELRGYGDGSGPGNGDDSRVAKPGLCSQNDFAKYVKRSNVICKWSVVCEMLSESPVPLGNPGIHAAVGVQSIPHCRNSKGSVTVCPKA